eukprot:375185-Pyramimonas_sp.AAC.2
MPTITLPRHGADTFQKVASPKRLSTQTLLTRSKQSLHDKRTRAVRDTFQHHSKPANMASVMISNPMVRDVTARTSTFNAGRNVQRGRACNAVRTPVRTSTIPNASMASGCDDAGPSSSESQGMSVSRTSTVNDRRAIVMGVFAKSVVKAVGESRLGQISNVRRFSWRKLNDDLGNPFFYITNKKW